MAKRTRTLDSPDAPALNGRRAALGLLAIATASSQNGADG
jgi:hypothetical protein